MDVVFEQVPRDPGRLSAGWRAGRAILPGPACATPALRRQEVLAWSSGRKSPVVLPRLAVEARHSCCECHRWRSESRNSLQDFGEQRARDRDFGHLERNVSTVANDFGADLDQLLPQTRERPGRNRLRCRKGAQEVSDVIRERMKLKANGVCVERAAGESRPFDRALSLFDLLLCCSTLVVKRDHVLAGYRQIRDDETHPREQLARMPLHFGYDTPRM
jgi:hypothetical protein